MPTPTHLSTLPPAVLEQLSESPSEDSNRLCFALSIASARLEQVASTLRRLTRHPSPGQPPPVSESSPTRPTT